MTSPSRGAFVTTPLNIDDLLRETEATSFTLKATTAKETQDLDDDLNSLVVFQQECERRLNNLTEGRGKEFLAEERKGEDSAGGGTRPCDAMQRRGSDGRLREGGDEAEGRKEGRADGMTTKEDEEGGDHKRRVNGAMEKEVKGGEVGRNTDCESEKEKEVLKEEEKEEEEEEMKLAEKSLLEAVSDLTKLYQPPSAGESVKPKSKLRPRKSPDYQRCSASDHFGGGHKVVQRPRPQTNLCKAPNSATDDLERELANLLDSFLQEPKKSGDGVHAGETTTTTSVTTINYTTTTTTAAATPSLPPRNTPRTIFYYSTPITPTTPPPPPPHHPHHTTPTTPTTPPPSAASTEDFTFTYPTFPISSPSLSSFPLPSPSPHDDKKDQQTFFSGLKEGMKNMKWGNSLKRKRKKRDLVIGHPKDFRQLTATTSIKPDADPFIRTTTTWRGTGNGTEGQGTEQRDGEWNK